MSKKAEPKMDELKFIYEKAGQSQVVYNVSQEYITTTADKIRICLHKHIEHLGKRRAWTTPLGILLTILLTFSTTTFKEAILSAQTWQAVFIISGIISGIWLVITLRQIPKAEDEEDIIRALKQGQPATFDICSESRTTPMPKTKHLNMRQRNMMPKFITSRNTPILFKILNE